MIDITAIRERSKIDIICRVTANNYIHTLLNAYDDKQAEIVRLRAALEACECGCYSYRHQLIKCDRCEVLGKPHPNADTEALAAGDGEEAR